MTDTLLRRIPAVDVKLDEFMFIPIHHSYNSKDFMPRVFGQEQTITTHSSEYQQAINNFSLSASKKDTAHKAPKYLIKGPFEIGGESVFEEAFKEGEKFGSVVPSVAPNLILLHSAMILRPKRLRIPTVVSTTTVIGPAGKPSSIYYITDEVRDLKFGGNTWDYKNAAFKTPDGFIEQDKNNDNQVWMVREKLGGKLKFIPKTFLERVGEEKDRDPERFEDIAKNIRQECISVFRLAKNQPFFVQCRLHRMPGKYKKYARSSFFQKSSFKKFYPDETGEYTSLEIQWGGNSAASSPCQQQLKLVIRGGAAVSMTLYRNTEKDGWKQYGSPQSLPAESVKKESHEVDTIGLTIYPMGRHLIVASGEPSTEDTLKGRYVFWDFDEFVNIADGNVKLHFYGGKTEFAFNPIIHVEEGKLISAPVGIGFDPELYFLKVDYEGKFVNDYFGDKNSNEDIQLPIPTKEDMGGNCAQRQREKSKGKNSSKSQKKEAFFKYLEEHVELKKLIVKDGKGAGKDEDLKKFYKLNQLQKTTRAQFKYQVTLRSEKKEEDGGVKNPAKRVYSPIVYKIELQAYPRLEKVSMAPNPQIDNADVRTVEVTQGVEEVAATVLLWNRFPPENRVGRGPYTFGMQKPQGNFTGVKPITIKGGISSGNRKPGDLGLGIPGAGGVSIPDSNQPIQMKGFISERNYSRPSSSESYCELHIQDVSKQAKEQYAVNLPIFDGWCNLATMYVLGKEAGYTDDQILFYQNPRDPGDKITIKQVIEAGGGDVGARQGGCFSGHVPKFPQTTGPASRVTNLPPSTIHALMPLNAYREQPAYMFQMGTTLWQCMQEIREFTGFFLYANIHGNIVYSPAEVSLGITSKSGAGGGVGQTLAEGFSGSAQFNYGKRTVGGSVTPGGTGGGPQPDWNFYEISGGRPSGATDYSQYQGHLDVPFGTDHVRNAVMTFALISAAEDPTNPAKYSPIQIIKKQPGWPFNVNDPSYIPWLKWLLVRSPHWNDFSRAQANTTQRFARGIQPRTTPTFGAWGHALVYPYDIIKLNEGEAGETGIDGTNVIVQEITKTFDAEHKSFFMELSCEYVNFSLFQWSPHENQGGAAQTVQR